MPPPKIRIVTGLDGVTRRIVYDGEGSVIKREVVDVPKTAPLTVCPKGKS